VAPLMDTVPAAPFSGLAAQVAPPHVRAPRICQLVATEERGESRDTPLNFTGCGHCWVILSASEDSITFLYVDSHLGKVWQLSLDVSVRSPAEVTSGAENVLR
jgi:hypothetical protein